MAVAGGFGHRGPRGHAGAASTSMQRYSEPSWRDPVQAEGLFKVLDEGQMLIQELRWEAEAKLMSMLACITSRKDISYSLPANRNAPQHYLVAPK